MQRLLSDRRRSMNNIMLEGPRLVEAHPGEEGEQAYARLCSLEQKWKTLVLEAEQRLVLPAMAHLWQEIQVPDIWLWQVSVVGRRASLELILPKAQLFQEGVDSLQQWFVSVEQALAELRNAERVMLHLTDATDRAKVQNYSIAY